MAIVLLVRHGMTDTIGRSLSGRTPGVHLNDEGRRQAERLGEYLGRRNVAAIFVSPMERAVETAAPIAARTGQSPMVRPRLNEMDFGAWNGLTFGELDALEQWKRFNVNRTGVRPPGGEHVIDVQERMVAELEELRDRGPSEMVVMVGHADPLKTVLSYYLGFSLELLSRIELSPGSLSELFLDGWTTCVRSMNVTIY